MAKDTTDDRPGQESEPGTAPGTGDGSAQAAPKARPGADAAAKARLIFGDPLDRQSRDDTDTGWGDRPGAGESGGRGLDWYLSQRPPHHGD
ncbi:hypothetical protein SAMN05216371_3512 [Streptomyces sp. TLI_053]|uniref:hypothetical protein n=1 Tax=Streptomyces sp. TLI_053 TaxID=1855352 RepID=UPI00087B1035|nr:hypothetical protein [Streptomyces sp. TLI_053]SDT66519.1 hypothetical protein SAMN05216371_3512 [Streptomyces sp. TLI_053]